jgi:hypothetical protein
MLTCCLDPSMLTEPYGQYTQIRPVRTILETMPCSPKSGLDLPSSSPPFRAHWPRRKSKALGRAKMCTTPAGLMRVPIRIRAFDLNCGGTGDEASELTALRKKWPALGPAIFASRNPKVQSIRVPLQGTRIPQPQAGYRLWASHATWNGKARPGKDAFFGRPENMAVVDRTVWSD